MGWKSWAAMGRKVSVSGARIGKAVARRVRMWVRRGGEGVVRWAGVRFTMEVMRVWVLDGAAGGGGGGSVGVSS